MRTCLTASVCLVMGLIHPVSMSSAALSGDLDGSGSGSGDWSEAGEVKNIQDEPISRGSKNTLPGSSLLNVDGLHKDGESGFVIVTNSKSFLENKEVLAALISGGVAGVALAATLAALLIYTQRKAHVGYVAGQQRAAGGDHYRPSGEEGAV